MDTASESDRAEWLQRNAIDVLKLNDLGWATKPSPKLYPHQWLWDSCFIALGWRHIDPARAASEVLSLFRGQWSDGMLPHVIFSDGDTDYHAGPKRWRSDLVMAAPVHVRTTGITQPPMVAEAAVRVGSTLEPAARTAFYRELFPKLTRYHEWLYRERDPAGSGLVTLVHAWESGMDNTPVWMRLARTASPLGVRLLRGAGRDGSLDLLRKDTVYVPADERISGADLFTLYHILHQLRRVDYESHRIFTETDVPTVQDVVFNAILIRANHHLRRIAEELSESLPSALLAAIEKAPVAFEGLYRDGRYWSRDARTGDLVQEPTLGCFLALYSGAIPAERAERLADRIRDEAFWPRYGIASVPTHSRFFKPRCYWQGPVWVNMNWLIADGLERYGFTDLAARLRADTLAVVERSQGMFEYFSPLDGTGAGTSQFSWTAALVLDLLATAS